MSGRPPDEPPSEAAPGAQRDKRRPSVTAAGAAARTAREGRRADALRRNLGRRKTQARARSDGPVDGEP